MIPYGLFRHLKPCFLSLFPLFSISLIRSLVPCYCTYIYPIFFFIISLPTLKMPPSYFPDETAFAPLFPSLLLTNPLPWKWSSLTLLLSAVILGCLLTFEDLELGTSNEKEYVTFVFLSLYHHIQYVIYPRFIYLASKFIFSVSL